ncbi:monovalent cation/H+ antiporter complex subunit F [Methanothermobacter sp.]|uniref:monovalent cation/H+ antiporter complex subunit F n=1 Tax=Methanothermobacter sp. TaxID=1884223 RepID=UPI003C735AFF
MDLLMISEYVLMASLAIFSVAAVRIATRKSIGMGLVGISALSIAIATILILINRIYGVGFCRDIAYALVLLGPVGTIAFARVLRG